MHAINKDIDGIERSVFVFTHPYGTKYSKTIFKINTGMSPVKCEAIFNEQFDFYNHNTEQVGDDLYALCMRNTRVFHYKDVVGNMSKSKVTTLGVKRFFCTFTNYKDEALYIVGGSDESACQDSVHCLNLDTKRFAQHLPSINRARRGHGACCFRGQLFIMGGNDGQNTQNLASIEFLDVQGFARYWQIIENVEGLGSRDHPLVSHLENDQFLVAGGYQGKMLSDAVIMMARARTANLSSQQIGVDCKDEKIDGLEFFDQAARETAGEVISIGRDRKGNLHAARFSKGVGMFTSFHNFGHE